MWLIVGVVGLAIIVAGSVFLARRRALPAEKRRELPAEPAPATPTAPSEEPPAEPEAEPGPERPEAPATRMARLRRRLAGSNNPLARGLLSILSSDRLDADVWDDFEATLITSDLGVGPTQELTEALRRELAIDGVNDPEQARRVLRRELLTLVGPDFDRSLDVTGSDGKPGVVLVVGVNGTGKTTTIGKLAHRLAELDKRVVIGAADTFRAAAIDQLAVWAERSGAQLVRQAQGADPGAVAYDAVAAATARKADVVLIDTAGRLQTQHNLMEELSKVAGVVRKIDPTAPHEVLLVVDSTTGQNGLSQARLFKDAADVSGVILTKLDGTAKGGIAVAIHRELGLPVKLVGSGERLEDLQPFDATAYARAMFAPDGV